MSFDKIFHLTAGVYFYYYNILVYAVEWVWSHMLHSRPDAIHSRLSHPLGNENQKQLRHWYGSEKSTPLHKICRHWYGMTQPANESKSGESISAGNENQPLLAQIAGTGIV